MRKIVVLLILGCWAGVAGAAAQDVPGVLYRYGSGVDVRCQAGFGGQTVIQTEVTALRAKMPAFQAAWDAQGPALLAEAQNLLGKKFRERGVVASFVFCRPIGSLAVPLTVDANLAIGSESQPGHIITDIVFHELLHSFLFDHYRSITQTGLALEYEDELPRVRAHLHLFAIEAQVYRALGRDDVLAEVIAFTSSLSGANARAWDIVGREGAAAFIAELTPSR